MAYPKLPQGGKCKGSVKHEGNKLIAVTDCTVLMKNIKGIVGKAPTKAKAKAAAPSSTRYINVEMGGVGAKAYAKTECKKKGQPTEKSCVEKAKESWKAMTKEERKAETHAIKEAKTEKETISAEMKEEEKLVEKGERRSAAERGEPYKPSKVDGFF